MNKSTKDDLILFYYGELDHSQNKSIRQALADSASLQLEYAELCDFLDNKTTLEVPPPSDNFNQQIMTSIYQQVNVQPYGNIKTQSKLSQLIEWLTGNQWHRLATASMAVMLVTVGVFFLGRWSSLPEQSLVIADNSSETIDSQASFSAEQSQRVLFSNVSSHLEMSGRLLTMVSNGNGELAEQIESRKNIIEELVALNRLYRRVAQQSGDKQLAGVLQQMESILIELNHIESDPEKNDGQPAEFNTLRDRLEESDLIYQMKVTNKKLDKKFI